MKETKFVAVDEEVVKELKARGSVVVRADGAVELGEAQEFVPCDRIERLARMLVKRGFGLKLRWDKYGRVFVKCGVESLGKEVELAEGQDLAECILCVGEARAADLRLRWEIVEKFMSGAKRPTD